MSSGIHHRRSIRLQRYDYAQAGAYFVTICTQNRECLLGEVVDGEMILNDAGRTVQSMWDSLPDRFPFIELDQFGVMPNHVHGIIVLTGRHPTMDDRPHPTLGDHKDRPYKARGTHAGTIGRVVQAFKSVTIHGYGVGVRHHRWPTFDGRLWQRNYHEHIIRDEDSLNRIREYIAANPLRWELDRENPQRTGEDEFDCWLTEYSHGLKKRSEKL
jgi:REP element-mobilizing transposase RayT